MEQEEVLAARPQSIISDHSDLSIGHPAASEARVVCCSCMRQILNCAMRMMKRDAESDVSQHALRNLLLAEWPPR